MMRPGRPPLGPRKNRYLRVWMVGVGVGGGRMKPNGPEKPGGGGHGGMMPRVNARLMQGRGSARLFAFSLGLLLLLPPPDKGPLLRWEMAFLYRPERFSHLLNVVCDVRDAALCDRMPVWPQPMTGVVPGTMWVSPGMPKVGVVSMLHGSMQGVGGGGG